MLGEKSISPLQFGIFRVLLGVYLLVHFAHLIPYGGELFSRAGVLPEASRNLTHGLFPNPLAAWDSPRAVTLVLGTLAGAAVLLAAGIARRPAALLLWFGWAALFHRNNLISNPAIPYVGLLLLLTLLVPVTERLQALRRGDGGRWGFPASVYWTAWILLATGYTYSGLVKLGSPSWLDGSAMLHVLQNPLARPTPLRELLLELPRPILAAMTWGALGVELLALPLSFFRIGRLVSWVALVSLQLGILSVVAFADLTAGMLLAHLFVLDPDWWRGGPRPPAQESSGVGGGAAA